MKNNNNKGFSLTETIITIGILSVIGVTVLLTYKFLFDNSNIDSNAQLFKSLQYTSDNVSSVQYNYENISTNDFINNENISNQYKKNNSLVNASGENINIEVDSGSWTNSNNDLIKFTSNGYNRKQCTKLISQIGPDFYATQVNNSFVTTNKNSSGGGTGTMNMESLSSHCRDDDNTISFWQVKFINLAHLRKIEENLMPSSSSAPRPDETNDNGGLWYARAYQPGTPDQLDSNFNIIPGSGRPVFNREYSGDTPQQAFARAICYTASFPTSDLRDHCYQHISTSQDTNIKSNPQVESLTDSNGSSEYPRVAERGSRYFYTGAYQKDEQGNRINMNGGNDNPNNDSNDDSNDDTSNETVYTENSVLSEDEESKYEYQRVRQISALELRP